MTTTKKKAHKHNLVFDEALGARACTSEECYFIEEKAEIEFKQYKHGIEAVDAKGNFISKGLIAAAPFLLAALKQVRKDFEMLQDGSWDASTDEGRECASASIEVIDIAIAKAKGRIKP